MTYLPTEEPKLQQLLRPREPGTGGMWKIWIQKPSTNGQLVPGNSEANQFLMEWREMVMFQAFLM